MAGGIENASASTQRRNTDARVKIYAPGATNGRWQPLRAIPTEFPGLIVHKDVTGDGITPGSGWTLTHVGSGRSLAKHFPTRAAAMKAASEVADLVDWTIPTMTALMAEIRAKGVLKSIGERLTAQGGSK